MQNTAAFFKTIENHYTNNLPFVVYSRPINSIVKCWLQQNDTIYTTNEFSEPGFVFAPFDFEKDTILFPKAFSDFHEINIEKDLEVDSFVHSEIKNTIENDTAKKAHVNLVSKAIEKIKLGEFEKVVLSHTLSHKFPKTNPIKIFKTLFNTYKNAMVYCWFHPKIGLWLGATPELLFKIEGQQLTTISLAGTQKQKNNTLPKWSHKELQEQQIVTDYLNTQIKPYAITTKTSSVESVKAGHLWHLKTRLVSRLKPNTPLKHIIETLHPTPAVCGFPKEKSKQFILKNEKYNRSFYTGFLGELHLNYIKERNVNKKNIEHNAYNLQTTQSNFYVNLRCVQLKKNEAIIYVGGGITKDSEAEKEWEETCNKALIMAKVL